MRRRAFALISAISFLLCIAGAVVWEVTWDDGLSFGIGLVDGSEYRLNSGWSLVGLEKQTFVPLHQPKEGGFVEHRDAFNGVSPWSPYFWRFHSPGATLTWSEANGIGSAAGTWHNLTADDTTWYMGKPPDIVSHVREYFAPWWLVILTFGILPICWAAGLVRRWDRWRLFGRERATPGFEVRLSPKRLAATDAAGTGV